MSDYPIKKPEFAYPHLLVFDTLALLSADKSKRLQVWRNNEQLGECYIPGATYAEISRISQDRKNSDFESAKEFLEFVGKGSRYKIQPKEDNRQIPLDNEKDRQILACAHRLARENPNSVVILVTYDRTMKGLTGQSGLPNFCTLAAKDLSDWFFLDYYRGKVPQAVDDAYQRMKRLQPANSNNHKSANDFPKPNIQPHNQKNKPKLKGNSQSWHKNQNSQNTSKPAKKPGLNPLIIAVAAACAAIIALPAINNFIGNNSGTIVAQAVTDSKPVEPTPANLISKAESSIIQFQNTKEPSILRQALNELQSLKNQQGLRLDKEGEQRLSRLKHKYAIEVLASSGQKAEAVKMLGEIPSSYSDYKSMTKSLNKLKR